MGIIRNIKLKVLAFVNKVKYSGVDFYNIIGVKGVVNNSILAVYKGSNLISGYPFTI